MRHSPTRRESFMRSALTTAVLVITLFAVGCGHPTSPTIPTSVVPSASSSSGSSGTLTAPTATGRQGFGFNAPLISGFPGGRSIELTGGGDYDPESGSVHSGGGFRCLSDIAAGQFNTCLTG